MTTATAIIGVIVISSLWTSFCRGADNSGNEFYLTVLENYEYFRGHPRFIVSLTTKEDYPVNVTFTAMIPIGRDTSEPVTEDVVVEPRCLTTKQLFPDHDAMTLRTPSDRDRGIHVKAENDKKISVIGTNEYPGFGSMDAFLALPVPSPTAASKSQTYTYIAGMVPSQGRFKVNVGIVAYANNTELQVTPTQEVKIGTQLTSPGNTSNISLDKGQSLLIAHELDLSGTRVVSSHPIAFFVGSRCASIPSGASGCDHLLEQVPPVEQWGAEFITAPLATRSGYDVFKIIASNSNTEVRIHCSESINSIQTPLVLNAGEFTIFNISSSAHCYISASQKVLLLQFSTSQSVDNAMKADPFMAMVPAISHYSNFITFMTVSSSQTTLDHYINIYVLSEYFQPGNIMLNARSLADIGTTFTSVPSHMGSSTPKAYVAQLTIRPGLHMLNHTMKNAKMGVLVYGFGNETSYGYPGGLALDGQSSSVSAAAAMPVSTLLWGCVTLAVVLYLNA